jgi:hypothetical protein
MANDIAVAMSEMQLAVNRREAFIEASTPRAREHGRRVKPSAGTGSGVGGRKNTGGAPGEQASSPLVVAPAPRTGWQ